MSGSGGVSIARTAIRGENRFYNPPPMRKLQQEAQLQKQIKEKQQQRLKEEEEEDEIVIAKERRRAAIPPRRIRKGLGVVGLTESKNQVVPVSEVSVGSSDSSGSDPVQNHGSNLDRFLKHTTPFVPVRFLPKMTKGELKACKSESRTYFVLEDLWQSFEEWSAYGAGVPLQMDENDSTVQYYVPYLSGIQLYLDPSKKLRNSGAEGSSKSRLDKFSSNPKTSLNTVDSSVVELNRMKLRDRSSADGETEINNLQGRLVFEYLEYEQPYGREPLANKVSDLALRCPELMTYRSCDLSPSSWFSVSWYPIYRIPVGPTLQNLDACFLTFHSLSTKPSQSSMRCTVSDPSTKLQLPTFGLASYKLKASVWNQNGAQESQKMTALAQSADEWLKRLQVNHPDYRFFTSHR